jgi:hypothetical protein
MPALPLSRFVAIRLMKEQSLVSCPKLPSIVMALPD